MNEIKGHLSKAFKMKDVGSLHYFLGVNTEQTKDEIRLSQKQYIIKMIERYGLQDANPVSTPMDMNVKHVADDGYSKAAEKNQYQSMIGNLLCAAIAARPDISHAVGPLSKFNPAPRGTSHSSKMDHDSNTIQENRILKIIGYIDAD